MLDGFSSETLENVYDSGHRGFKRSISSNNNILSIHQVDLQAILTSPNPKKKIQALPPQSLFHALKKRGLSDSLEVLAHITPEQFTRICDYDVWHEDSLVPKQLFYWLSFYKEISPKQMAQRFSELDEEYQIAALNPFIRAYTPDDYEKMTDSQQDELYRFPGDALFYSIDAEDSEIHKGISDLLDATMDENMSYAMALVAHSAYHPPNESCQTLSQFRKARLEEDGFVSYSESLECFEPVSQKDLENKLIKEDLNSSNKEKTTLISAATNSQSDYLTQVLARGAQSSWSKEESDNIYKGCLYLANSLCAACQIDTDDSQSLKFALEHACGLIGLALEIRSQGDLDHAAHLLLSEYPKTLFRQGLSFVHQVREAVLDALEKANITESATLKKLYLSKKHGACLNYLDKAFLPILGHEYTEILKSLFNRFPLVPIAQLGKATDTQKTAELSISFIPLASLKHFKTLVERLESMLSLIQLANFALPIGEKLKKLDQNLLSAMLKLMLERNFVSGSISDEQAELFCSLDSEQIQKISKNLLQVLCDKLKKEPSLAYQANNNISKLFLNKSAYSEQTLQEIIKLQAQLLFAQKSGKKVLNNLLS